MSWMFCCRRFGVASLLWFSISACASPPDVRPQDVALPLTLESFFAGHSEGEGVFTNSWTGRQRRFHVEIAGTWDGTTLTLVEDFAYEDGEKDRKTWTLRRTEPGAFAGTREDVVGMAHVWTDGPVVRLAYDVRLGGWTVAFADVLSLRPDGLLINRATIAKWGIRLGGVELLLHKRAV